MDKFTFEDANTLDWSNEYIDFVMASKLLMLVYDDRIEAEQFKQSREELVNKYQELSKSAADLADYLRRAFPIGAIGGSREQTQTELTNFMASLFFATADVSILAQSDSWANKFDNDPIVVQMWKSYLEFCERYKRFVSNGLGGTLKFHRKIHKLNILADNPRNANKVFLEKHATPKIEREFYTDKRIQACFDYWRELIRLYYESGLKCWWAPTIQFMNDLSLWSGKIHQQTAVTPTLDGMLGPVFSRLVNTKSEGLDEIGEKELSAHCYHEYLLLAMTRKQLSAKVGLDMAPGIHKQVEDWGYDHGGNWERVDFEMFFDRIFLHKSVEDLEGKIYDRDEPYTESTIKRKTGQLSALLGIPLPRADYQPRILH